MSKKNIFRWFMLILSVALPVLVLAQVVYRCSEPPTTCPNTTTSASELFSSTDIETVTPSETLPVIVVVTSMDAPTVDSDASETGVDVVLDETHITATPSR